MKVLNSAGASCLFWVWGHVFPALMENSAERGGCQCLQTWISGIKPTETHCSALSPTWKGEIILLDFTSWDFFFFFWGWWFVWVLKIPEIAVSVLLRSVKDFHVCWGAESSFCQLWVHLELLKELFWPGWHFPANIGAASPINHMCHIFHPALPVVCAKPGAEPVLVVVWDFLFLSWWACLTYCSYWDGQEEEVDRDILGWTSLGIIKMPNIPDELALFCVPLATWS